MASATITLTKDATSITVSAPPPGRDMPIERAQVIGQTAAGADYVYDKSYTLRELVLPVRLPESEWSQLYDFWLTTCVAGLNTFTLLDHFGVTHSNCRFLDNKLPDHKTAGQMHEATIRIRVGERVK